MIFWNCNVFNIWERWTVISWYELNPRVRCAFGNVFTKLWMIIYTHIGKFSQHRNYQGCMHWQKAIFHHFASKLVSWSENFPRKNASVAKKSEVAKNYYFHFDVLKKLRWEAKYFCDDIQSYSDSFTEKIWMPLLKQSISSYKPVIERNIAHEWKVVIGAKIQPKFQLVYMLHIFKKKNFSPTLHICFQNLTRRNSFCFCHSCRSRGQNFCSARFPVLFSFFREAAVICLNWYCFTSLE